jgi:hypothetical protein
VNERAERLAENRRLHLLGLRRCPRCGVARKFSEFGRPNKKGHFGPCLKCRAPASARAYLRVLEADRDSGKLERLALKRRNRELAEAGKKECAQCHQVKTLDLFEPDRALGSGRRLYRPRCLECSGTDPVRLGRIRFNRKSGKLRICKKCGVAKPPSEFYARTGGGLQARCKTCYNK